ncbi:MAG: InlB B-repeat-containing protein [Eggerthellaceae bacterium]|jgi:uncharacterized repeat protein (TIGR02543 family)
MGSILSRARLGLAGAAMALCLMALAFAASPAFADTGYVTVNDDTTQYATLDEAAAAATATSDGSVTYHIYGDVTATEASTGTTTSKNTFTTDENGASNGITTINIIGEDAESSSLTLDGQYCQALRAPEATLNLSNLTVYDNRPTDGEGNDAFEFTYIMLFAPEVNCTDCVFKEGVMVGQVDGTASFKGCTFSPEHVSVKKDGTEEPDLWQNHYGLWLELYGTTTVDDCDFTNCAYGAIKSLYATDSYNTRYASYRSKEDGEAVDCNVNLTVTDTTFENCGWGGEHRPMHFDGIDSLTVKGCTFTDCYNEDATADPTSAEIVDTKTGAPEASFTAVNAVNADYLGDNSNNNTFRYSVTYVTEDGTLTTKYYDYALDEDQTYSDIVYKGYHYSVQNAVTVEKGTAASYTGDDAVVVTKGDPITYKVAFNANGGKGTMAAETMTYDQAKALTKNAFTRSGYTFKGWSTSANGKVAYKDGASASNLTDSEGTVTLYAVWQKLVGKPVLLSKVSSPANKKATVSWKKIAGADGYDVYFARCGKNLKKVATTKNLTFTKKGLKKGNFYHLRVVAYKMVNGKKVVIAKGPGAHFIAGKHSKKYTNAKSIKVAKKQMTLKAGNSAKVKANQVEAVKGYKFLSSKHVAMYRYASSNKKIATVSKTGKVTAKAAGTCKIYVYAQNGKWATVKVTVK